MHFEQLVVDFIKQGDDSWTMIGIIAYKFDLSLMAHCPINIHPYIDTSTAETGNVDISLPDSIVNRHTKQLKEVKGIA